MNCSTRENLNKILESSFGVKEGSKVSPSLADNISVKLDLLRDQFSMYDFDKEIAYIENGTLKYNHENLNELEDAIDAYEEKFTLDYDNRFSQLVELQDTVDMFNQEELNEYPDQHELYPHEMKINSTGGVIRYSPTTTLSQPVNLMEWEEERHKLRKNLNDLHSRLLKEGYKNNSEKINRLNNILQKLDNEIKSVDLTDPQQIYISVANEVNTLRKVLTDAASDPINASIEFESSKIRDRIDSLNTFFTGKDMLGTPIDITSASAPGVLLYDKVKAIFDADKYNDLSKQIEELTMIYETKVKDIIKGVIESNALVKENVRRDANWTEKKYKLEKNDSGFKLVEASDGVPILDLLKDYLEKDLKGDVNFFSSTLGAASGGGILGDILHNIKNDYYNNEVGATIEEKNKLSEDWKKLKDKTETLSNGTKDFVYKKLFRKDVNGVRMNQIVSAYSDRYFEDYRAISNARSEFYKNHNEEEFYSDWMKFEKEYTTKIDPKYLSSAKLKHGQGAYQRNFASDEDIAQYESELRNQLGDTMFEIETRKALQKLDNFIEQDNNGGFSYIQQHTLNPFRFMDHYDGKDFNKKDSSTAMYMMPDYIHSIPNVNNSSYKSDEFYSSIDNNNDLREVWKGLYNLLEYTNPFLKSEGIPVGMLELPQYEDLLDREVTKDLSLFGRIFTHLKEAVRSIHRTYYDAWFDRESRERDETQQGDNVNVYYTTSPKIAKKKMVNVLTQNTFDKLKEIAKEEGIEVNISIDKEDNKAIERRKKFLLANSIAQNRINKTVSSNLVDSMLKLTDVVNNAKARQNTLGVYNLFLDFTRKAKLRGNAYVYDYLNTWGETNIVKNKYSDSAKFLGVGETRFTKQKLTLLKKYYTPNEKQVLDTIRSIKENPNKEFSGLNIGTKENPIYLEGVSGAYTTSENGVVKTISDTEAETLYEDYLNKEMDRMGVSLTLGSLFQGLASNMTRAILAVSLKGGVTNRQVGYLANLKLAASNRYGYNEQDLHQARKFLLGTNALKYWEMAKRGIAGEKYNNKFTLRKSQDVETVKMFVESLSMLQNKADELALENRFGNSGVAVFVNNLKDLIYDPNINNPEWHNQTEVILSILSNTPVTTVDGVEKPFFDGNTTIFKPGTLELKDEFDTPENRRMWVDFAYDNEGKNDHVNAIAKISRAKDASQGNYNPEDVMPLQSTLVGKLGTIFLKYLPENTFHNWGYKKVDLRSGIIDYKGSKLVLAQHTPTLALYMGLINATKVTAAVGSMMMLGTAIPIIGWSLLPQAVIGGAALYLMRNNLSNMINLSKNEFLLAGDFAIEVGKRSANSFVRRLSGGHLGFSQSFMDKKFIYQQENLSEAERNILSESAQEVANKFMVYASFFVTAATIKALYLIAMMGSDDKDEERLYKLKQLDGALNALQNIRENINEDIERFSNPKMFTDAFTSSVFVANTYGWIEGVVKVTEQYIEGTKDGGDIAFQMVKAPFVPLPRNLGRTIFKDQSVSGFYEDARVWREPGEAPREYFGDKLIREQGFKQEEVSKKNFEKDRRTLRNRAKDEIEKALIRSDNYPAHEIDARTKELTDQFMKVHKKKKNQTYSDLQSTFSLYNEYKKLNEFKNQIK